MNYIIEDYVNGVVSSVNLFSVVGILFDLKILKVFYDVLKIMAFYFVGPNILMWLLLFSVSFFSGDKIGSVEYILSLSVLFMETIGSIKIVVTYVGYTSLLGTYVSRENIQFSVFDKLSSTLTILIFQVYVYVVYTTIDFIFEKEFPVTTKILNMILLSFYFSFYCYNGWWSFRNKTINFRLKMCENNWPYFLGYGTIISMIHISNVTFSYMTIIYYLYLTLLITLPFFSNNDMSRDLDFEDSNGKIINNKKYMNIGLSLFSWILCSVINGVTGFIGSIMKISK